MKCRHGQHEILQAGGVLQVSSRKGRTWDLKVGNPQGYGWKKGRNIPAWALVFLSYSYYVLGVPDFGVPNPFPLFNFLGKLWSKLFP